MSYKIIKKSDLPRRLKLLLRSARKRDIHVDLNIEYYRKLLEVGCIYCGSDLMQSTGYCLDRGDNSKGYITGNVFPCCGTCNRAKGTMAHCEFVSWIDRTYLFQREVADSFKVPISDKQKKSDSNKLKNRAFYKNSDSLHLDGSRK